MKTSFNMHNEAGVDSLWNLIEEAGKKNNSIGQQNAASNGSATNGTATNGSATNGSATNGSVTNGTATNSIAASNDIPDNGSSEEVVKKKKKKKSKSETEETNTEKKTKKKLGETEKVDNSLTEVNQVSTKKAKKSKKSKENVEERDNIVLEYYKGKGSKREVESDDDEDSDQETRLSKSQKRKRRKLQSSATDEPDFNFEVKKNLSEVDFVPGMGFEVETIDVKGKFKWRRNLKDILRAGPPEGMKFNKILNKIESIHNHPLTGAEQPLAKEVLRGLMMKNLARKPFSIMEDKAKIGKFKK